MKTKLKTNIHIGGRQEVCPEEVVLFVALENYTQVIFENGNKTVVATTLKELERRFSKHPLFFRTHKSFLINLNFVANHENLAENFIQMSNNKKVIVSRRKKMAFQMRIHNLA